MVKSFVRLAPFALALAALAPAPAAAQFFFGPSYYWGAPDVIEDEPVPLAMVVRVLRASGYRLVGRPRIVGEDIIAIGARPDGRRARFVIDAYDGALIRTTLLNEPRRAPVAKPKPDRPAARVSPAPHATPEPRKPARVAPQPAPNLAAPQSAPNPAPSPAPNAAPSAAPPDIGPQVKPVEARPAETKPAETKPVETNPTASAPAAQPPKVELPAIPPAPPFANKNEPNGAP